MATLTIRSGRLAEFEAYERKALTIAARYGGRLDRSVRTVASADGGMTEIHVLSFPTEQDFGCFRDDGTLAALSEEREAVISGTELLVGFEGIQVS